MQVYYDGEDDLTRCIARRLIENWAKQAEMDIQCVDLKLRARGRAVLSNLDKVIALGERIPVVYVFDADTECPVRLLEKHCHQDRERSFSTINIAIDEGEAWLLADKKGIASFLGIKQSDIPKEIYGKQEVNPPYKTSLYIMRELVPKSGKKTITDNISMAPKYKKPPTYNNVWPEFIEKKWNIDDAVKHSESLKRAVNRIAKKLSNYVAH